MNTNSSITWVKEGHSLLVLHIRTFLSIISVSFPNERGFESGHGQNGINLYFVKDHDLLICETKPEIPKVKRTAFWCR